MSWGESNLGTFKEQQGGHCDWSRRNKEKGIGNKVIDEETKIG